MFIIIGLGNPGSEYTATRHNLGFRVIDAISLLLKVKLQSEGSEYIIGTAHQYDIVLVKPLTYMNNSGIVAKELVNYYCTQPHHIMAIVDDFHIPLGTLRLRNKGSDGGHNGLRSIIYHLQSEDFPRLRCGISGTTLPTSKKEFAEYVLAPFEKNECDIVEKMIMRARDAAVAAATHGIGYATSAYNGIVH